MSSSIKKLLSKGQLVEQTYKVGFLLSANNYTQVYRVTNEDGGTFILSLYSSSIYSFNELATQKEVQNKLGNDVISRIILVDKMTINEAEYYYVIQEFIVGESLSDKLLRLNKLPISTAKRIGIDLLNKLSFKGCTSKSVILNNISDTSLWIDMTNEEEQYRLLGLTRSHFVGDSFSVPIEISELAYISPEALEGNADACSDIFSIGVLLYRLCYGYLPWDLKNLAADANRSEQIQYMSEVRNKGITKPTLHSVTDMNLFDIITRAISNDRQARFQSSKEFLFELERSTTKISVINDDSSFVPKLPDKNLGDNSGFSAIAGMDTLKETIQVDIINALNNRTKYKEYGLGIPNGMLFYGPPGCGKTFFAEKMAEEINFNFFKIKPSDIQSKWVNATQENIKNLFDSARKEAPSIIFIDEIDAIVPHRNNERVNHMNTSAVNELLAQMNNCGEDEVFVVAATNIPNSIDPAVLRTGRIDKKIFVPTPDFDSRVKLFSKMLEGRPINNVDVSLLADKTDRYVASDIKFICDEAARSALKQDKPIEHQHLISAIISNQPSISEVELAKYLPFIN